MPFDLVVRHGLVVSHDASALMDLGVRDGRVVEVGHRLGAAAEEVDATGLIVMPGLVDAHVHLREPGMTEKEDFFSGTRAAAAGGVTTVVDMPNTVPAVATAEIFASKLATVTGKAHVDFGLYGMLGQDNAGEIAQIARLGALWLKLFMGQTTGDNACPDDAAIFTGLSRARDNGLVVGAHAENDKVLRLLAAELRAGGRTDPIAHLDSRPSFVEEEAISRITTLARGAGARLHIHHLSTAAGLDLVNAARLRGQDVTCEVLVGHLLLDDSAYARFGNLIKLNPPIRPASDVAALWRGLQRGQVDVLATDHAPHTVEEQSRANVWEAPGGFIGVETMLPLMLTEAAKGRLSLERLVRIGAWRPAHIWGLSDRKGHLGVGADADFNLVEPGVKSNIDQSRLHSRHPVSPYDGWATIGAVRATYLRGVPVAKDGQVLGGPTGQFVTSAGHRARSAKTGHGKGENNGIGEK
jgi:allantoinase